MATKEEILRELYPEDLFHYADGLTLGEAEVLQETRRLIEKHLRPVINDHQNFISHSFTWNWLVLIHQWLHSILFMADFAIIQSCSVVMNANKKNFFLN